METGTDKLRAFLYALGVHLAFVLMVVVGLAWTRSARPVSVAGPVIEATLVAAPVRSTTPPRAPRAAPRPPAPRPTPTPQPPTPEPEPDRPEAPPVPPIAEDTVDQERIDRLALEQAEAEREQEERRKREQLLLEEQARLAALERERQSQLEDLRRRREDAQRRRELEEQRLAQLEERERAQRELREALDEPAAAEESAPEATVAPGNEGTDDSLLGHYVIAIQQAVTRNWLRPDHVQQVRCAVEIIQIPGGEVLSASVKPPCDADEITRRSLEAAVLRAQPLPYDGYETVFQRKLQLNFCYPGTLCQG